MRFSCDSCGAQYQIADEKIGPRGVRVRCKRCDHIIVLQPPDRFEKFQSFSYLDTDANLSAFNQAAGDLPGDIPEAPAEATVIVDTAKLFEEGKGKGKPGGQGAAAPHPEAWPEDNTFSGGGGGGDEKPAAGGPPSGDGLDVSEYDGEFPEMEFEEGDTPSEEERASTRVYDDDELARVAEERRSAVTEEPTPAATQRPRSLKVRVEDPPKATGEGPSPSVQVYDHIDWFLAINDEQVGPLRIDDVERRWELGEIEANTLAWHSGLSDWKELHEVDELRFLLDRMPEPSTEEPPAPAPRSAPARPASAPERPAPAPAPVRAAAPPSSDPDDLVERDHSGTGQWAPSAASALASLVEEELARDDDDEDYEGDPLPGMGPEPPAPSSGLELPPAPAVAAPPQSEPELVGAPLVGPKAQMTSARRGGGNDGKRKKLIIAAAAVLVVAIGGAAVALTGGSGQSKAPKGPQPIAPPVAAAPAAAPAAPKASAAQAAAAPVEAKPVEAPPKASGAPPTSGAGSVEAARKAEEARRAAEQKKSDEARKADEARAAAKALEKKREAEREAKEAREAEARRERERKERERKARAQKKKKREKKRARKKTKKRKRSKPKPEPKVEVVRGKRGKEYDPGADLLAAPRASQPRRSAAPSGGGGVEDDFDRLLAAPSRRKKKQAAPKKTSLGKNDVMGVVKRNSPGIKVCRDEHVRRGGTVKGKLKMGWKIMPNGRTSQVSTLTPGYKGSYLGQCVETAIKRWKFPQFSGSPIPVKFPFKL